MDLYNLNYIQLFGIVAFGIGIMMCFYQLPIKKRDFKNINTSEEEQETIKKLESPTKRLRTTNSMEKLNHYFDIEENKTISINIKSKSTQNILNKKDFEIENIIANFEKYKLQCGICKSSIPSYKEVYCYMDNRFCSEDCREHYYKIQNDNFKRRFSL